jgi:radical SAM protein with 4Fe4S-binding SPASM domain
MSGLLPSRSLSYPYFMQIEPTSRCDLTCRFCPRGSLARDMEDLTPHLFQKIVDRNPGVVAILLQGLGEPLLSSHIEDMIRYGRSKRIYVGLCTNGMKLTEERFGQLIRSGLNYLAISVDGTDRSFEALRGGARFERLHAHLAGVKKRGAMGCVLAFWTTLSAKNLDQIVPILDLAKASGVDHVHFQDLQYKQDPAAMNPLSLSACLDDDARRDLMASTRRKAFSDGIVCTFDPLDRQQMRTHCRWPWEGLYVDCKGDVRPCCVAWEEGFAMGNLLASPLDEIWNHESYRRFRLGLREGPVPRICRECRFL